MKKRMAIIILTILIISVLEAREKPNNASGILKSVSTMGTPSRSVMDIGNFSGWVQNDGMTSSDPFTGGSGAFYPKGTVGAIYRDGIVWGGIVQDPDLNKPKLRVGGQTYGVGTQPGKILSVGVAEDPDLSHVRIYRIRRDYLSVSDDELLEDAAMLNNVDESQVTQAMLENIRQQYTEDWNEWPGDLGAPYYDLNENGQWDSGVDEPGIADADQVSWFVCNDLNEAKTRNLYGSPPTGIELQITMWAYNQKNSALGQSIFRRYHLINKSGFQIDSMYVSQWSDLDIGDYGNDLIGCDKSLDLGFAYNGNAIDNPYYAAGLAPAAAGYSLLQGPMVPSVGDTAIFNFKKIADYKNLKMTSFGYFGSGTAWDDPDMGVYDGTLQWYNLLRGYAPVTDLNNPPRFVHTTGPLKNQPTKFPLDGDPVTQTGDVDGIKYQPGDRRILFCSGLFDMAPGDEQQIIVAMVGGLGSDHIKSVEELKNNVQTIRNNYTQPVIYPKHNYLVSHPDNSKSKIYVQVDLSKFTDVSSCKISFNPQYGDEPGFTLDLYDDGSHNDSLTNDNIWANSTIQNNRQYPTIGDLVIGQGSDSLVIGKYMGDIRLRPIPQLTDWKVVWENGKQDASINHNENVQVQFDIQNTDNYNQISDILFINLQPESNYQQVKYEAAIMPGSHVTYDKLKFIADGPASGDTLKINYRIYFDHHSETMSSILPVKAADLGESWGDTLEVINIIRPNVLNACPIVADEFLLTGHNYEITFSYNTASELVWNLKDLTGNTIKLEEQYLHDSPDWYFPIVDGIEWKVYNPKQGIYKIAEYDQADNELDGSVSYLPPSWGTTGYLLENRDGTANGGFFDRDFDQFDYWGDDNVEINFADSSITWDYGNEEVHFDSLTGEAHYAPFAVYRHTFDGNTYRLFAGFWDTDGDGTWNNNGSDWRGPLFDKPSYEPIYCWQGYDGDGNPINYDPTNEAQYIADNNLETSANTTWGGGTGEIQYPYVTATLFTMYLNEATPPWGNKVMFFTNKATDINDTLRVKGALNPLSEKVITVTKFNLSQNYPNPFNPVTSIKFSIPYNNKVSLEVYNILGQKVCTLINKDLIRGEHIIEWNGRNDYGNQLGSGIYFYRIKTDHFIKSMKMILLK